MNNPGPPSAGRKSAAGTSGFQFVRLDTQWIQPLLEMLDTVDGRLFHPHPFSRESIEPLVESRDEYWLLVKEQTVVGYGMLRGWEEGYAIPSLGIAVSDSHQGRGHGKQIMRFLHDRAIKRGAARVRLTVAVDNLKAQALYRNLGYRQSASRPDGSWYLDLDTERVAAERGL